MKIVFTGGGTGGHFYPLIATTEYIEDIIEERKLLPPELFYIGPTPFDATAILEHDIVHKSSPAGKIRNYRSILNVLDTFKTGWGIVQSIVQLFVIYPDVVFSTGGYAAFPTLCAARILAIPVIIYDADAQPGRVSLWSAKFARYIAIAHPFAGQKFPEALRSKIALIGHPIRKEIRVPAQEGVHEFLHIDSTIPTIFIIGGSQGAKALNEAILDALPQLVEKYNVIHQTGRDNLAEVNSIAGVVLKDSNYADRYKTFGLMNTLALRMSAGAASLIISRAGSGTIFEIAQWKLPSILIPIPPEVSHDQTENAFSYARTGAAVVIEQGNLTTHLFVAEIERLMSSESERMSLAKSAGEFAKPDAGKKLAQVIVDTALEHEPV